MRKRIWLFLAAGLFIGADDVKKELDRFEGDWKLVSVEVNGMNSRAPLQARVAYRVDHAVLRSALGGRRLETVDGLVVGFGLDWH